MKVWSKGLGKMVLEMDLRRYYLEVDNASGDLLIKGKITEPVLWDFKFTLEKSDIPGLIRIALQRNTLAYVVKNSYMSFVFVYEKMFKKEKYLPAE